MDASIIASQCMGAAGVSQAGFVTLLRLNPKIAGVRPAGGGPRNLGACRQSDLTPVPATGMITLVVACFMLPSALLLPLAFVPFIPFAPIVFALLTFAPLLLTPSVLVLVAIDRLWRLIDNSGLNVFLLRV